MNKLLFYTVLVLLIFLVCCDDLQQKSTYEPLWEEVGTLDTVNVYSFVIDPFDNLYIGSVYGLYKSSDHGKTWNRLTITVPDSDQDFHALAIDRDGFLLAGDYWYLLRSTDQGLTWTDLYASDRMSSYISVIEVSGDTIFVAQNRGHWSRSNNNGMTWTQLGISDGMRGVIWTNDGRLLAGTRFGGGIHRSSDNGDTWQQVRNWGGIWSMAKTSSEYILAGTDDEGILRTTDNGDTWSSIGPETNLIYDIQVLSDSCILTTGESGRIYLSPNEGESWFDKTGNLGEKSIWGIALDSQGYVYLAAHNTSTIPSFRVVTSIYRAKTHRLLSR